MTKKQSSRETLKLWVIRLGNLAFYALMGKNPLKEEAKWAEHHDLVARAPQDVAKAIADAMRERTIARYLNEERN